MAAARPPESPGAGPRRSRSAVRATRWAAARPPAARPAVGDDSTAPCPICGRAADTFTHGLKSLSSHIKMCVQSRSSEARPPDLLRAATLPAPVPAGATDAAAAAIAALARIRAAQKTTKPAEAGKHPTAQRAVGEKDAGARAGSDVAKGRAEQREQKTDADGPLGDDETVLPVATLGRAALRAFTDRQYSRERGEAHSFGYFWVVPNMVNTFCKPKKHLD